MPFVTYLFVWTEVSIINVSALKGGGRKLLAALPSFLSSLGHRSPSAVHLYPPVLARVVKTLFLVLKIFCLCTTFELSSGKELTFLDLSTSSVIALNISSTLMLSLAEVSNSLIPIWSANLLASSVSTTYNTQTEEDLQDKRQIPPFCQGHRSCSRPIFCLPHHSSGRSRVTIS